MGDVLMGRNVGTRIRSDRRDAAACRRSSKARGCTDPRRGKRGAGQGSSTSARGLRAPAPLRTQGPQAPLTLRGPRSPQRPRSLRTQGLGSSGCPDSWGTGSPRLPSRSGDLGPLRVLWCQDPLRTRGPPDPFTLVGLGSPGCPRTQGPQVPLTAGSLSPGTDPDSPGASGSPQDAEREGSGIPRSPHAPRRGADDGRPLPHAHGRPPPEASRGGQRRGPPLLPPRWGSPSGGRRRRSAPVPRPPSVPRGGGGRPMSAIPACRAAGQQPEQPRRPRPLPPV